MQGDFDQVCWTTRSHSMARGDFEMVTYSVGGTLAARAFLDLGCMECLPKKATGPALSQLRLCESDPSSQGST